VVLGKRNTNNLVRHWGHDHEWFDLPGPADVCKCSDQFRYCLGQLVFHQEITDQFYQNTPNRGVFIFYSLATLLNICMDNPTQITVVDLDLLRNIVDLACRRGAFNGAEVKQVGEVYEKLSNFLQAVVEQAKAQEEAQGQSDIAGENPQGE